jgi:hypothetical protein
MKFTECSGNITLHYCRGGMPFFYSTGHTLPHIMVSNSVILSFSIYVFRYWLTCEQNGFLGFIGPLVGVRQDITYFGDII